MWGGPRPPEGIALGNATQGCECVRNWRVAPVADRPSDHEGMVGRVFPSSLRIQYAGVWPRFITRVLPTYGRGREAVREGHREIRGRGPGRGACCAP